MTSVETVASDLKVRQSAIKVIVITVVLDLAILGTLGPLLLIFGV